MGIPRATVYEVGREVKISGEMRQAAKDFSSRDRTDAWKVRSRFVVRGHWRNQPHGPGRQLRKRLWIAPYWKGDEAATQLHRTYAMGELK